MRYVVLHHTGWDGHPDHYDVMLQLATGSSDTDRVLATFASQIDDVPEAGAAFERLPEHRRLYLDYQGPLSDNRGRVDRVDAGRLRLLTPLSPDQKDIQIELKGLLLSGHYAFIDLRKDLYRLNFYGIM